MAEAAAEEEAAGLPPIFLSYPDAYLDLPCGAGVYFHPVVHMKQAHAAPQHAESAVMHDLEAFVQKAHEYSVLFDGPSRLDHAMLKSIWDTTAGEEAADRVEVAVAQFLICGLPDAGGAGTESAGGGGAYFAGFSEKHSASKWKHARGAYLAQRMKGTAAKHLAFSVDPPLPDGLTLAERTGVISGKPVAVAGRRKYRVTCSSGDGEASTDLEFQVSEAVPPSGLAYLGAEPVLHIGQPVSLVPKVVGLVTKWTVRETLPPGLSLDPSTGTICGVATEQSPERSYTVIAKNEHGLASVRLVFAVVQPPPSDLRYNEDVSIHENEPSAFARNVGSISATRYYPLGRFMRLHPSYEGIVTEFKVRPELPSGLELDPQTGVISGTPTIEAPVTAYAISAHNASGSCSTKLPFAVKVMRTEQLAYPQLDEVYFVGETVELEPRFSGCADAWSVEPSLPQGLTLCTATGRIAGAPLAVAAMASYTVTAASGGLGGATAELRFEVAEPPAEGLQPQPGAAPALASSSQAPAAAAPDPVAPPAEGLPTEAPPAELPAPVQEPAAGTAATLDFAAQVENTVNLADMPEEPNRAERMCDWMVWTVHRAWLNDPALTALSWSGLRLPLPHEEPRVAPKLMQALATNSHLTTLELAGCGLRAPQGLQLAAALRANGTLQSLNIDSNHLDPDAIHAIVTAVAENPVTSLCTLHCGSQKDVGTNFGKNVEQAVAQMLEKCARLTAVTFPFQDPHWRSVADRALQRNVDSARRRRKGNKVLHEKPLTLVVLQAPPPRRVQEVITSSDPKLALLCQFTASKHRLPTKEQLLAFARNKDQPLRYAEVAPLVKAFKNALLDAAVDLQVTAVDVFQKSFPGTLTAWSEKNDRGSLTVQVQDGPCYEFMSGGELSVEVSEAFATWLTA